MHRKVLARPPGILWILESYESRRHRIIPVQRERPCLGNQGSEDPEFRSVVVDGRDSLPPEKRIEVDNRLVRVEDGTREAKESVPNRVMLLAVIVRLVRAFLTILLCGLLVIGRLGFLRQRSPGERWQTSRLGELSDKWTDRSYQKVLSVFSWFFPPCIVLNIPLALLALPKPDIPQERGRTTVTHAPVFRTNSLWCILHEFSDRSDDFAGKSIVSTFEYS